MNIGDIARMAGVSKATVSRYMNNGYISEDKKKIISKIINETGYKPSSYAITLRTKKTGMVAVIIPKISSESVSRMVEGISSTLTKNNYKLLLANTFNDAKEEVNYIKALNEYKVDGIILLGTLITEDHLKCLKESKIPIVVLAQKVEDNPCIYYDDFEAARKITETMIKNSKKVAYIGVSNEDVAAGFLRYRGFLQACQNTGIKKENIYFTNASFDIESGYQNARKVLSEVNDIDSVFCSTDTIAFGFMKYAKEIKKSIPNDIQIVGIGNNPLCDVVSPKLTSVSYPYKQGGIEAARLLIKIMKGHKIENKEVMLECEVVERESIREH